jgi:SAM-dependent methyltransferase
MPVPGGKAMLETIRSVLDRPLMYQFWATAIGGHEHSKVLVKEYIRPAETDRILDIGCGPGTIVPYLPTSEYVGFDANPEYIALARRRFPGLRFVCERVSNYSLPQREYFEIALALGVLHHLADCEAIQLLRIAYDALKPGGRLVTHDPVWTNDQSRTAKYLMSRDRGRYVRTEDTYLNLASQSFATVKSSIRHDLLRIPFTHLILECRR